MKITNYDWGVIVTLGTLIMFAIVDKLFNLRTDYLLLINIILFTYLILTIIISKYKA